MAEGGSRGASPSLGSWSCLESYYFPDKGPGELGGFATNIGPVAEAGREEQQEQSQGWACRAPIDLGQGRSWGSGTESHGAATPMMLAHCYYPLFSGKSNGLGLKLPEFGS